MHGRHAERIISDSFSLINVRAAASQSLARSRTFASSRALISNRMLACNRIPLPEGSSLARSRRRRGVELQFDGAQARGQFADAAFEPRESRVELLAARVACRAVFVRLRHKEFVWIANL